MIDIKLESAWEPVDGFELEIAAMAVVKSDYNTYVVAGPGAGKTELLAQKACYLLQTNKCNNPRKILAISFKKDAARNLAERVRKRCGNDLSRRFVSQTYDGFAKNLLDRFMNALPKELRPDPNYEIAYDEDVLSVYNYLVPLIKESRTKDALLGALTSAKLTLPMPSEDYLKKIALRVWQILLRGDEKFTPKISFMMICRLCEFIIRTNPLIHRALLATYSHVFLDEFQDTTYLQYDLIKTCFQNTDTNLTAVGDEKQRIMVWAGAYKEVFQKFEGDFDARENLLLINHRSAPRLVEVQKILAKQLAGESVEIQTSEKWDKSDGICEIWDFSNHEDEAIILTNRISHWIENEGLKPEDICVIIKQKVDTYGTDLIKHLNQKKIIARNESEYQDLLADECVQLILDIILLAFSNKSRSELLNTLDLLKVLKGIFVYDDTDGKELRLLDRELSIFLLNLKVKFNQILTDTQLKNVLNDIINYLGEDRLKEMFPKYQQGIYFEQRMTDLSIFLWKEFESCKNWLTSVEMLTGKNSVSLMTIHKSKGLEYDTVIFLGLEDSAFWSFGWQADENTRGFFVALSRAKRRVIFTYSRLRNTGRENTIVAQKRTNIKILYDLLRKSGVVTERSMENAVDK